MIITHMIRETYQPTGTMRWDRVIFGVLNEQLFRLGPRPPEKKAFPLSIQVQGFDATL
jgi:hypothetical protein